MSEGITIVYDAECPFCSAYVRMLRLRAAAGAVRLIDARSDYPIVAEIRAAGLDLDRGMVLKMDGRLHHGDACLNRLALMSTGSGAFNRINRAIFSSPRAARWLYPALVAGRNAALRLMGRGSIADGISRSSARSR
jgi:predicted DCC family thiol-disulfide oxidoreductase YuxK